MISSLARLLVSRASLLVGMGRPISAPVFTLFQRRVSAALHSMDPGGGSRELGRMLPLSEMVASSISSTAPNASAL